jgi:uncharacterized membrane protein YgcG
MTRIDRKPKAEPPKRRRWLLLLPLLLVFVWWLWPDGRLAKARALQNELFSGDQTLTPEERQAKFGELRNVTREMSPADRAQLSKESLKRREDDLRKYAQLSAAEKKQRLDQDIDRQERRRQQQAQNPAGTGRSANGFGGGPGGAGGSGGPGGQARPTTADDRERRRQQRLDQTTPEFRELTDQYRHDLNARRTERGLPPMPTRPPR